MLRIDNLRKSFVVDKGEVRAVQNVSIDIAEGQCFTLKDTKSTKFRSFNYPKPSCPSYCYPKTNTNMFVIAFKDQAAIFSVLNVASISR